MEIGVVKDEQFREEEEEEEEEEEYRNDDDDDLSTDEDVNKVSNVFKQILEINGKHKPSAAEYQSELEKRGMPFKLGLIDAYLNKFPFEDEEYLPNSEYYYSDKGTEDINAHELVKRFLKQVRESNGYDVDCFPPDLVSPFIPVDDKEFYDDMMEFSCFAIEKINAETGKTYEVVRVENAVYASTALYLLTFTVKKTGTGDDASLESIRAMVFAPTRHKDTFELEEWRFKPSSTDISRVDVDPGKKKAKVGDSSCNLVGLSTLGTPILERIFSALEKKSAVSLSLTCKRCWFTWVSMNKS